MAIAPVRPLRLERRGGAGSGARLSELRGAAYAGAAGIALAQILRGAHFPADVLAGSLIGVAAEATTHAVAERRACGGPDR